MASQEESVEVACPKCKVKLAIPQEKLKPEGSRFKCPKCTTVLLVKKPLRKARALDKRKVLVAVADPGLAAEMKGVLEQGGYEVYTSQDGVDAMIAAVRELPCTAILDVALPKIYGFEVCRRLKMREETKEIKVILFTSVYDEKKYRREPTSLYGADAYVEAFDFRGSLLSKVEVLAGGSSALAPAPRPQKTEEAPKATVSPTGAVGTADRDEWEAKARRLARTVLADIFLYNPQRAEEALRGGQFLQVFASEVKEGRKLYEGRIPKNVREKRDFFDEEVMAFLEEKKNKSKW